MHTLTGASNQLDSTRSYISSASLACSPTCANNTSVFRHYRAGYMFSFVFRSSPLCNMKSHGRLMALLFALQEITCTRFWPTIVIAQLFSPERSQLIYFAVPEGAYCRTSVDLLFRMPTGIELLCTSMNIIFNISNRSQRGSDFFSKLFVSPST